MVIYTFWFLGGFNIYGHLCFLVFRRKWQVTSRVSEIYQNQRIPEDVSYWAVSFVWALPIHGTAQSWRMLLCCLDRLGGRGRWSRGKS